MKKYTIEYVRKSFEKEGYELLEDNYDGCKQKLSYRCPVGHEHVITFDSWLRGRRCYYCKGNVKLTTEFVKKAFEKEGYGLLSEYKNSGTKLNYICPEGHRGHIKWDHWRDGHRCAECAGNKKLTIDNIKESFIREGYELLSKDYRNSQGKLKYRCPQGHIGYIQYYNWVTGYRCLECSGRAKKTLPFIKKEFEKEGYTLLTNHYENCNQKLHLVCPNNHDYFVSWDNWNHSGSRCTECKEWGTSRQESLIKEFLKSIPVEIIERDRSLISPYELDFVLPEEKIAIEYCGLYWHSELLGKGRKYHIDKLQKCCDNGYRLITIFEDELVNNEDVVFSRLSNIIGVANKAKKVFARKCSVKEIHSSVASNFCNKYHLQGYNGSNIKLGLFYDGELVSVMTFSKPSISKGSRKNIDSLWELQRFCSKTNYRVVGGASKLLKHFERTYDWKDIFSYADRRWSEGVLYNRLGFEYAGNTEPNYWYLKGQNRLHRFALRKTEKDPKDQTEWEIRKSQGWNRIWDCGNLKFEKSNK